MASVPFTPEMIAKAKTAASPEELMQLAKEKGISLEAQAAAKLFAALNEKANDEMTEEELNKVAGGSIQRPVIRR